MIKILKNKEQFIQLSAILGLIIKGNNQNHIIQYIFCLLYISDGGALRNLVSLGKSRLVQLNLAGLEEEFHRKNLKLFFHDSFFCAI